MQNIKELLCVIWTNIAVVSWRFSDWYHARFTV